MLSAEPGGAPVIVVVVVVPEAVAGTVAVAVAVIVGVVTTAVDVVGTVAPGTHADAWLSEITIW
jgi:hypothetical protein